MDKMKLINKLAVLWMQYAPTMRFMQFISNFTRWEAAYNGVDIFYLPDEVLLTHLKNFCQDFLKGDIYNNEKDF